ncbi:MAG: hypothetical protein MZV63_71010 [Marinilabiliales bacterium]|nr:hypothetical protein [Marinilabiliales bacterium]
MTPVVREALPGLEVLNWKEIQTDLAMIADYMNQIYAIFMVIDTCRPGLRNSEYHAYVRP